MKQLNREAEQNLNATFEAKLLVYCVVIGILCAISAQIFHWMCSTSEYFFLEYLAGYRPPSENGVSEHVGGYGFWLIPVVTTLGSHSIRLNYSLPVRRNFGWRRCKLYSELSLRGGSIRKRVPVARAVASALAIGSGGTVGREGPMAHISAGIGSLFSRLCGLSVAERRLLVVASAAAGVSAMFRSPLGAAFLAVEVLYSTLELEVRALIYAVVAASVAYAAGGIFFGWEPIFRVSGARPMDSSYELIWYALLGISAGLASIAVPLASEYIEKAFSKLSMGTLHRIILGGLIVGLIGFICPQILGGGYGWMQMAISGQVGVYAALGWGLAKILALAVSMASRTPGGTFAPILYIGAMFGASLGLSINSVSSYGPDVASMAIVGMAAFYAGLGRTPIAAMIITSELIGGYSIFAPTMIAVSLAFLIEPIVGRYFNVSSLSIYANQVPSLHDSPTHQQEYVQNALKLLTDLLLRYLEG